jgi:hypothetical protein
MPVAAGVLWLCAAAFAGFGAAFALAPDPMAALIDIQLASNTARADFIATYGGFELGFAFFLLLCARDHRTLRLGLLAAGCALTGFAATRLLAIVLLGDVRPMLYWVLAMESTGAALAFVAAARAPRGA